MVGVADPDPATGRLLAAAIPRSAVAAATAADVRVVEAMCGGDDMPGLQVEASDHVLSLHASLVTWLL